MRYQAGWENAVRGLGESYAPVQFGGSGNETIIYTKQDDSTKDYYIFGISTSASILGVNNPKGAGNNALFCAIFNYNLKFKNLKFITQSSETAPVSMSALIDGDYLILFLPQGSSVQSSFERYDKKTLTRINRCVSTGSTLSYPCLTKQDSLYVVNTDYYESSTGSNESRGIKITTAFDNSTPWTSVSTTAAGDRFQSGIYSIHGEKINGANKIRTWGANNNNTLYFSTAEYDYNANTIAQASITISAGYYKCFNSKQPYCTDTGTTTKMILIGGTNPQTELAIFKNEKASNSPSGRTVFVTDSTANDTTIYGIIHTNKINEYLVYGDSKTAALALQAGTRTAFVRKATWNGSTFTLGTPKKLGVAGSISGLYAMQTLSNNIDMENNTPQYYPTNKMLIAYHSQGDIYGTSEGGYDCILEIIDIDKDL